MSAFMHTMSGASIPLNPAISRRFSLNEAEFEDIGFLENANMICNIMEGGCENLLIDESCIENFATLDMGSHVQVESAECIVRDMLSKQWSRINEQTNQCLQPFDMIREMQCFKDYKAWAVGEAWEFDAEISENCEKGAWNICDYSLLALLTINVEVLSDKVKPICYIIIEALSHSAMKCTFLDMEIYCGSTCFIDWDIEDQEVTDTCYLGDEQLIQHLKSNNRYEYECIMSYTGEEDEAICDEFRQFLQFKKESINVRQAIETTGIERHTLSQKPESRQTLVRLIRSLHDDELIFNNGAVSPRLMRQFLTNCVSAISEMDSDLIMPLEIGRSSNASVGTGAVVDFGREFESRRLMYSSLNESRMSLGEVGWVSIPMHNALSEQAIVDISVSEQLLLMFSALLEADENDV
jgi:hypothetical protein